MSGSADNPLALLGGDVSALARVVVASLDSAPIGAAVVTTEGLCVAVSRRLESWGTAAWKSNPISSRSMSQEALLAAVVSAAAGTAVVEDIEVLGMLRGQGPWRVHALPLGGVGTGAALLLIEDRAEGEALARAFHATEERFRSLVDGASLGIVVHRVGVLMYANPEAVRVLHQVGPEDLAGIPLSDLVHPSCREALRQQMLEAVRTGLSTPARHRFLLPDGADVELEVTFSRAPSDHDETGTAFLREVVGRDHASTALEAVRDALQEALEALERGATADRAVISALGRAAAAAGLEFIETASGSLAPAPPSTVARVLLCDDEDRLTLLMAGLLEPYGFAAVRCPTGAQAIEVASGQVPVDIAVVDVNLPGEDTEEVLMELFRLLPTMPIVLSSGYSEEDVPVGLRRLPNVRAFLSKPYSVDVLADCLKRLTASRSAALL